MASRKLTQLLTTPSKIASALDWRKMSGSVLSLNIHQDRIGLALARHPSSASSAETLSSIPLNMTNGKRQRVDSNVREQLSDIVRDNKVCGFVVSWPLQPSSGKMGAACGRVLFTLEQLLDDKETVNSIMSKNRQICLWDGVRPRPAGEDEWGRCDAYASTSDNTMYRASQESYHIDEDINAASVWEEFTKAHWPEQEYQPPTQPSQPRETQDMLVLTKRPVQRARKIHQAALL